MNDVKTLLDLALLMWVVVFIVDVSGFRETVLAAASRFLGGPVKSLKPLTCSLCLTWWAGLVYLTVAGSFTLTGVAMVALVSVLTQPVASLTGAVLDLLNKIINLIQP